MKTKPTARRWADSYRVEFAGSANDTHSFDWHNHLYQFLSQNLCGMEIGDTVRITENRGGREYVRTWAVTDTNVFEEIK